MNLNPSFGIEQARATLPALVAEASAGKTSVITRHGKPVAAIVPLASLANAGRPAAAELLQLRGTGQRLWGADVAGSIDALRSQWR